MIYGIIITFAGIGLLFMWSISVIGHVRHQKDSK